jgi:hypothetical protein
MANYLTDEQTALALLKDPSVSEGQKRELTLTVLVHRYDDLLDQGYPPDAPECLAKLAHFQRVLAESGPVWDQDPDLFRTTPAPIEPPAADPAVADEWETV